MPLSPDDRFISPGKRKRVVSINPANAEAAFPLGTYLVPTGDPLGRSISMSVSMAPGVRRVISAILTKRLFGFQNEPDALRWCIDNGIKELEKRAKDPSVTAAASMLDAWTSTALQQLEYLHYLDVLDGLEKAIDRLAERGHLFKAEELTTTIWQNVDRCDDPYWRKVYRDTMKKKLDEVRRKVRAAAEAAAR